MSCCQFGPVWPARPCPDTRIMMPLWIFWNQRLTCRMLNAIQNQWVRATWLLLAFPGFLTFGRSTLIVRKRYRMRSKAVERSKSTNRTKARVARHRTRVAAKGSKRVEVTVPSRDASLVKAIAGVLRSGGKEAKRIRDSLQPIVSSPKAKTGLELVAFFRKSPLVGANLQVERDNSAGRTADFS